MSKTPIYLSTLLLFWASLSAVSIQEGFEYNAAEDLSGDDGGTGFDAAWSGSSNMDVFDYTWPTWPGYTIIADKAIGPDDNGDVAVLVSRSLTSDINSETSPAIYFSFTLNGDIDDAGWINYLLGAAGSSATSSDANNLFFQYNGNDFKLRGEAGATVSALTRGADYLIVGKITFAVGQDTLEFSVFDEGGDLGTLEFGFQISTNPMITGLLDQLTIRMNNSSRLGNVRFGDTLADVGLDLPLISEGFIYPNGDLLGNAGGTGFSAAWAGSNKMDVVDYTWSSWINYTLLADKAAGPETNADIGVETRRTLTTAINAEVEQTLFFSYTVKGDVDDAGWTNFMLRTDTASTSGTNADNFFIQYNGTAFYLNGDAGLSNDTKPVPDGAGRGVDYLVVGQIDFAAGDDTGYMSVFAPGEDAQEVYTSFETNRTTEITGTLTELLLRMNNSSRIGNIRFGASLEEVGIAAPPPPLSRDPIVHFSFDDSTVVGSVVQDQSGNENDGTLTNTNQTVQTGVAGAVREAFFFPYSDADNGMVTLPSGIVPSGSDARSFACWFRQINDPDVDSANAQNKIFGYGNQSADPGTTGLESFDVTLRYDSANSENDIEIRGWGGTHQARDAGLRYEDEQEWKHLAIVVPEGATTFGEIQAYIDGVLLPNNSNSQLINTGDTEFAIGTVTGNGTSSNDYNGYVDEFYIYDVALTAQEVADLASITPAAIPGAIESFDATPRNRVPAGSSVTLSWDLDRVQPGSDVTISNGIGIVSIDADGVGSTTFSAPSTTTTYTITMTDETGETLVDETTIVVGAEGLPNIILFLVDDMGWADWEHNRDDTMNGDYAAAGITTGSTLYETPAMNQLAQEGIWFRNAYADSPVCSPTRASILSGQSAARHKVTNWITGSGDDNMDLFEADWNKYLVEELRENSVSNLLSDNGYKTIFVGKWHMGAGGSVSDAPSSCGFDVNIGGNSNGTPPKFFADSNGSFALPALGSGTYPQYTYLTYALTIEALAQIETAHTDGDAFFLFMSHYDVHAPIDAPRLDLQTTPTRLSRGADYYEGLIDAAGGFESAGANAAFGGQQNGVYASKVDHMDDSLGAIMDKLTELGIDDNTLIIFYSDNGGWETIATSKVEGTGGSDAKQVYYGSGSIIGENLARQATDNSPLHMGKGYLYEGGIREPGLFWWPGKIPAAQIDDTPIVSRDIYATILEVAGVAQPAGHTVDGLSLTPLLGLSSADFERDEVSIHYPHHARNHGGIAGSVVRKGDWKLTYFYDYAGRPSEKGDPAYGALVDDDVVTPAYVLYDLGSDPGETTDLVGDYSDVVALLSYDMTTGLQLQSANYPKSRIDQSEQPPAATGSFSSAVNADGDDLNAYEEFLAGTNDLIPFDGIGTSLVYASDAEIVIAGKKGRTYRLYRSTTLEAGSWVPISSTGPLTSDGSVVLSDLGSSGLERAFYTVKVGL